MKSLSILILLLVLIAVPMVSAGHDFEQNSSMPYGKVMIKDWCIPFTNICFGGTVATIELKENNGKNCGQYCDAVKEIHLIHDGLNLVDKVEFETIREDGSRVKQPIRSYQFYYYTKGQKIKVDDYSWVCKGTGRISVNGTEEKDCKNEKVGEHYEDAPEWTAYTPGTPMPKGKYLIKLEGEKRPDRVVDWIVTSNGEKIREWAVWGGIRFYDNFSDSNINQTLWVNYTGGTGAAFVEEANNRIHLQTNATSGNPAFAVIRTNYSFKDNSSHNIIFSINNSGVSGLSWISGFDISDGTSLTSFDDTSGIIPLYRQSIGGISGPAQQFRVFIDGQNVFVYNSTESLIANSSLSSLSSWYLQFRIGQTSAGSLISNNFFLYTITDNYNNVVLNSPANNYISTVNNIQFNCSANVAGGATLTNISLWTNSTGTWARNQSILLPPNNGIYDQIDDSSINATLWVTESYGATITEDTSKIRGYVSRGDSPPTETYYANLTSINLPTINSNLTFAADLYSSKGNNHPESGAGVKIYVFGNLIQEITSTSSDSSVYSIIRNETLGANKFDVYDDGVKLGQITASGNQITLYSWVRTGGSSTGANTAYFDLFYVYNKPLTSATANFNQTLFNPTLWSCQACDSDGDCGMASENRTVFIDASPPTINVLYPTGTINYGYIGQNISLNYSITDANLQACWLEYNNINSTISCTANSSFIQNQSKTLRIWANDSVGNKNYSDASFDYTFLQNANTYTGTVYQTQTTSYTVNVTNSSTMTGVSLIFNGTEYIAANLGGGIWSRNITIPATLSGIVSHYWRFYGSEANGTEYNQTINNSIYGLCNSTLNTVYLNMTFRDEVSLASWNASLYKTVAYFVGNGNYTKNFTYQNTGTNSSYLFCFTPPHLPVNLTNVLIQYYDASYPQRDYRVSMQLTNITTNLTLWGLSFSDGIYSLDTVVDQNGQAVADARIVWERQISGTDYIVGDKYTDDVGQASFWLNPNQAHTVTITKEGCTTKILSITPSASYTFTISCPGAVPPGTVNYSEYQGIPYITPYASIFQGVIFKRSPISGPISAGNNLFDYSVSSERSDITRARFELINVSNGALLSSAEKSVGNASCNSSFCYMNLTYTVQTGQNLKGRYYVDFGQGYLALELDGNWREITSNFSHPNMKDFWMDARGAFDTYTDYMTGEEKDALNRAEYSRIIFLFIILVCMMAFFNKAIGGYDAPSVFASPGAFLVVLFGFIVLGSIAGGLSPSPYHCDNGLYNHTSGLCTDGSASYSNVGFFFISNMIPIKTETWINADGTERNYVRMANFINNYIIAFYMTLITLAYFFSVSRRNT